MQQEYNFLTILLLLYNNIYNYYYAITILLFVDHTIYSYGCFSHVSTVVDAVHLRCGGEQEMFF